MDNKKVIITSDSTTDLPEELKEKYGIGVIPLSITLGDDAYKDGVDVDPDYIYSYVAANGTLPKTSAVNIADYTEFFKGFTDKGFAIVHFSLSSEMSTTHRNAVLAAEELEDVYAVDTCNLSSGGGLLVLAAAEMAKKGLSAKEIFDNVTALVPNVDASFVIGSLEYLHKGGRCSAVAAFGANLLKIKPIIAVKEGKMGVTKKLRGKYNDTVKEYILDRLQNPEDICLDRIFVTHSGLDEKFVKETAEFVKKTLPFKEVIISRAGCTISSHCGPECFGILFIRKSPIK